MITHVAIIYRENDSHRGKLYALPKPNRHHHVLKLIHEDGVEWIGYCWQGFLDHTGKFIGRQEAVKIATRAGQIGIIRPKTSPKHLLFSEDVW